MLAICGNSYSYGTEENTWPKILADKLKLPLLNISACAASNYFICYQIEHVLKYNPKIIIIVLAGSDRFELDDNDFGNKASIEDFNFKVDEVNYSPFSKKPTIHSGTVISHIKNYHMKQIKSHLVQHSHRLQAQYQSWCIQHMISKIECTYRLYRNIYPEYHKDIKKYKKEEFYGLDQLSGWRNSGPYDFEKEHLKGNESTNHLSVEENLKFAEWAYNDL